MRYQAHRIGGICTGLIVGELLSEGLPIEEKVLTMALITGTSAFGSLLPDIDEPSSYMGKRITPISKAIKSTTGHRGLWHSPFFALLLPAMLCGIYILSSMYGQEATLRKFSIAAFVLLFLRCIYNLARYKRVPILSLLWSFLSIYCILTERLNNSFFYLTFFGLFSGYLSHLFLDALTLSGVPLLYPFSANKYRILPLKTGTHDVFAIIGMIIITTLFFVFRKYLQ